MFQMSVLCWSHAHVAILVGWDFCSDVSTYANVNCHLFSILLVSLLHMESFTCFLVDFPPSSKFIATFRSTVSMQKRITTAGFADWSSTNPKECKIWTEHWHSNPPCSKLFSAELRFTARKRDTAKWVAICPKNFFFIFQSPVAGNNLFFLSTGDLKLQRGVAFKTSKRSRSSLSWCFEVSHICIPPRHQRPHSSNILGQAMCVGVLQSSCLFA